MTFVQTSCLPDVFQLSVLNYFRPLYCLIFYSLGQASWNQLHNIPFDIKPHIYLTVSEFSGETAVFWNYASWGWHNWTSGLEMGPWGTATMQGVLLAAKEGDHHRKCWILCPLATFLSCWNTFYSWAWVQCRGKWWHLRASGGQKRWSNGSFQPSIHESMNTDKSKFKSISEKRSPQTLLQESCGSFAGRLLQGLA